MITISNAIEQVRKSCHQPGPFIVIASQDAVILSGANPFSMYLKMPGSEDARTPEKFV